MAFERLAARLPGWLLTCVLSGLAAGAAAQPTAAERETARGLMQDGDRLREAGDLRDALERYQSAHAIMHVPTTGYDVARTEAALGMLVEARGVALEVSNTPAAAREPAVFTEARNGATDLAAQLDARIPSLRAQVTPAGAAYTVSIDDVHLPTEAREVAFRTNPGAHTLVVEAPGYAAQARQVTLLEGQAASVAIVLELPVAAAPMPLTAPGAVVASAASPQPLAAAADDPADPARAGRIRSLVGFAAGGALLLTGSVAGIVAVSKVSRIKDECPAHQCDATQRGALASSDTLANVANVTIPLGLLGIAYGVYEWLTLPNAPEPHARASHPVVDITGAGIQLRGAL
jgi:hypothetical protein